MTVPGRVKLQQFLLLALFFTALLVAAEVSQLLPYVWGLLPATAGPTEIFIHSHPLQPIRVVSRIIATGMCVEAG